MIMPHNAISPVDIGKTITMFYQELYGDSIVFVLQKRTIGYFLASERYYISINALFSN